MEAILVVAAMLGSALAAVTGFGVGSLLTPILALHVGTKLAVAAVSIPHAVATGLRLTLLRSDIDRRVLIQFGIPSALGGLTGALLHAGSSNPILSLIFATILLYAGIAQLLGVARRHHFSPQTAWIGGVLSGLLGGLVGNQGGIRAAGLSAFRLNRQAFVATATASGMIVDAVRMPVYMAAESHALLDLWPLIGLLSAAAIVGTLFGQRLLRGLPELWFERVVGAVLIGFGLLMLFETMH